ncbi:MAG: antitoxin family protein [Chloroflexi bacterium]|nr:antitoxin family protein [Chloroflexota bacterium]
MKQVVDAVYEDNVFRPQTPVAGVPEHVRLRLVVETAAVEEAPEDLEARIADIERLADAALGGLTPDEEAALQGARLEQQNFFDR